MLYSCMNIPTETENMTTDVTSQLSIDEIARDTGLGKDTLRVWERRYGFPDPLRTPTGDRVYTETHLERLRLICRLIDLGYRPGRVVPLSPEALSQLPTPGNGSIEERSDPVIEGLICFLESGNTSEFKTTLFELVDQQSPKDFVYQTAEPLLKATGNAWAQGRISIYLEHFVTQQLMAAIHTAQSRVRSTPSGLRVLLTTLPGEPHGMGVMLVELLLNISGVETINIGLETPMDQLQHACASLNPDVLALSFSAIQKRPQTMALLEELDQKIPPTIPILAGGSGITKLRALPKRFMIIKKMNSLDSTIKLLLQQSKH